MSEGEGVLMEQVFMDVSKKLKAIADPKRFRIIEMLSHGDRCASDILEEFCVTQPTLSHDMRILTEAGLVTSEKIGKKVRYSLHAENLANLLEILEETFRIK